MRMYEILFIVGILLALSGFTFMLTNSSSGIYGLAVMILGLLVTAIMVVLIRTEEERG
ncbi:MAG: hypothetical protein OEX77_07020 [Candidatus Bathyarchaeota archaeon]|nr:hypothetical protein [Candidatus Bathyarchaeota archaeon]MDH5733635.1 hypothetical protein [Candidatus Bathyarchaeota archaeon]